MGKVKRLELWWQLYRTLFPVWDLENFRPMDFCWHECTISVVCPTLQYFSKLSHKRYDFLKKLLNIKCVFWLCLQLLFETFLTLWRTERDMTKTVHGSAGTAVVIVLNFNEPWIFSTDFGRILEYGSRENPSSESPVAAYGRTDGQTWQI